MAHVRRFDRLTFLAVLFAVVGGLGAYVALRAPSAEASSVEARRPLVVIARPVGAGERLTRAVLRVDNVPAGAVPRGSLSRIEDVEGKFATLPMAEDEPVLGAKVSSNVPGSGLAAIVPPDRFAVSIAVSDVISSGGLLAPGDRVDVLGVASKEAGGAAQVVLRDVVVLAVANNLLGTDPEKARGKGGGENPRTLNATITLSVTIEEAQKLVQMDELGKLRLALRGRISRSE